MDKFSKLILSNGTDKITIEPMIRGIKTKGYRITETRLDNIHRRGLQESTISTEFENYEDIVNFVNDKSEEGYEIIVKL